MFTLLFYIYAGALAQGDSVALTTVPGFATEAACIAAGDKATALTKGSMKTARFVCLQGAK